ncbi:MAG: PHP domain-containing protein [Eubacteriales bacterium]
MGLVDLHTHTNYSDGTDSPEELISNALKSSINVLSITDHNTISAYQEISQNGYLKNYQGKFITGVELSTCFNHLLVEIIAYGFDLTKMQKLIKLHYNPREIEKKEKDSFIKIKHKIQELGFTFDPDIKYKPPFCTSAFDKELWKYPENTKKFPEQLRKFPELFYRYINDPSNELYTFDPNFPNCRYIINGIHEAGGKAFLAHPYIYTVDDPGRLVEEVIASTELDGVEVFYSLHSQDNIDNLLDITSNKKLLVSGGSDYHGKNKSHIKLGIGCGKLNVPEDYLSWINDLPIKYDGY